MMIEPKDLPTEVMDEMTKTFPQISWEIYGQPRDSLSEQDQMALRSFKVTVTNDDFAEREVRDPNTFEVKLTECNTVDGYTIRGVPDGECFRPWQILLTQSVPVL